MLAIQDATDSLREILTPNASGAVPYGAQNEPLRVSQHEMAGAFLEKMLAGKKKFHGVMPGGSGKTRVGMLMADAMYRKGHNSLFIVPSQQALRDFVDKARTLGMFKDEDIGAVYQGEKRIGKFTFVTYASLARRVLGEEASEEIKDLEKADHDDAVAHDEKPAPKPLRIDPKEFDLAIWDEAHMYLTRNARKLIALFDHATNIGLTATPRYYDGKEVAGTFGDKALEIDLDTAKARGEICDFENFLIDTGIKTGLRLASPEMEESAAVSAAINRADRNLIFADLYKDATIKVTRNGVKKSHTLTGEPTIIFGAGINHVNDMADTINTTLTPLLKTDEAFRRRLRNKNIDPDDPDLIIAAPIHSGGSPTDERITGMSLKERDALVERYHQRKVLILCATSVLQQSFDSPKTSVVIDSVPRQTYVGAGQAAMRATRPGKEIAFIINVQDADHPSVTFEECRHARGREEGVVVEISKRDAKNNHAGHAPNGAMPIAEYRISAGEDLQQLVAQRRAQHGPLYRDETTHFHFTAAGYERVNRLITQINSEVRKPTQNTTAIRTLTDDFVKTIGTFVARTRKRLETTILGKAKIDPHKLEDASTDALMTNIETLQSGAINGWSRFAMGYMKSLQHHLDKLTRTKEPMEEPLSDRFAAQLVAPKPGNRRADLVEAFDQPLGNLTPRETEVLRRRMNEETLEDIGKSYGICKEIVRRIEYQATFRLRNRPHTLSNLKPFVPSLSTDTVEATTPREEALKPPPPPLTPIEQAIVNQKRVIRSYLSDDEGNLDNSELARLAITHKSRIDSITDDTPVIPGGRDILFTGGMANLPDAILHRDGSEQNADKLEQAIMELYHLVGEKHNIPRPTVSPELSRLKTYLHKQLGMESVYKLSLKSTLSAEYIKELIDPYFTDNSLLEKAIERHEIEKLASCAKNKTLFRIIAAEIRAIVHNQQQQQAR